jgi:hypothetical protein
VDSEETVTSTFLIGQFVKPNPHLRKSWFEAYADLHGCYYPLLSETGDSTTVHISWEVEGIVMQLLAGSRVVVAFPQGLILSEATWLMDSDPQLPMQPFHGWCNSDTGVVGLTHEENTPQAADNSGAGPLDPLPGGTGGHPPDGSRIPQ